MTDGGGALILTAADRAKDLPQPPAYILGTGESVETPLISQMADFTSSAAFRVSGAQAFAEAGIATDDVDHLMIYDAFAHLPIFGLEDLGFVEPGAAPDFIWERNTAIGGSLPLNTNGGGLSYMHSGMYGMYALQESVRQIRGIAPAQVDDVEVSSWSHTASAACLLPAGRSSSAAETVGSIGVGSGVVAQHLAQLELVLFFLGNQAAGKLLEEDRPVEHRRQQRPIQTEPRAELVVEAFAKELLDAVFVGLRWRRSRSAAHHPVR